MAPLFLGSLLLFSIGIASAWYSQRIQKQASMLVSHDIAATRMAQELALSLREIRTDLNRYLLDRDPERLTSIPQDFDDARNYFKQARELASTDPEQQLLGVIAGQMESFGANFKRIRQHTPSAQQPAEFQKLRSFMNAALIPAVDHYLDWSQDVVEETSRANQAVVSRVQYGLVLLGVCGGLAGLMAGYGITRAIRSGLVELTLPVRNAAGKLDQVVGPLRVSAGDDFEGLRNSLEQMADQVGLVVARLQESQRQTLRAEQLAAVGQLAAGLAHELRNPLTSIKVLIQAAVESNDTSQLSLHDLAVMDEEISRMEQLINTFLEFARPVQIHRQPLDLVDVVARTASFVSRRAARFGVHIEVDRGPCPICVEADGAQLRQLVLNLLLNAIDAASAGGGRIWVDFQAPPASTADAHQGSQPDPAPPSAAFRVLDNGCGLPDALGNRIFEPFVSAKPTGIGLGLSISRRVVEAHGGTITAEHRTGGGAVFTVRLPASTASAPPALPTLPAVGCPESAPPSQSTPCRPS